MAEEAPGPVQFEDKLAELEAIVKKLEGGDLTLEESLRIFERGVELSKSCEKELEDAETKIEILTRRGNQMEAEPFGPEKS